MSLAPNRAQPGTSATQMERQTTAGGTEVKRSGSFLNPTGVNKDKKQVHEPKAIGPYMEMLVFFSFVMIRAVHPVVIDASKSVDDTGKKSFAYQTSSVVVLSNLSIGVLFSFICLVFGGKKQFVSIFQGKAFMIFFGNGFVYALGDFMEMASMGGLSGAAYQILLQSKIIVTATLMIFIKGVYQTRLQWTLLCILMCAMSVYMVVASSAGGGGGDSGGIPIMGMCLAFLKVFISCIGAVVSDKYMKVYSADSTNMHLARTFLGAFVGMFILSFAGDTWRVGFFTGWDGMTGAVCCSFIVKSAASVFIVALLDSILKNIGESFSVLVIYTYDVLAPWVDKTFDIATFLSVLVVVAACAAYVDAKVPIEKADKWDKEQKVKEAMAGK